MFEATFYHYFAIFNRKDVLGIGNLRNAKFLSNLGTYLSGIAVDGLTSTEDEVVVSDFFNSLSEGV